MFECIVCNNEAYRNIERRPRDSEHHSIFQCENCGLVQLYPMPSIGEDKEFYDQDNQAKFVHKNITLEEAIEKGLPDVKRRIHFLDEQFGNDRSRVSVLEIGSGYGLFLKQAFESGYDVEGIEISDTRRNIASRLVDCPIYDYNLMDQRLDECTKKKYDAVVMFQVLEHIQDPVTFLMNAKTGLKSTGQLIIEVPNVEDHLLAFCNEYNLFYWQRAHLSYYSASILEMVIKKAGFTKVNTKGVQRYSLENAMHWLNTGQPQINKPLYAVRKELQWLDSYYRSQLTNSLTCDTLVATAYL